MLISIWEHTSFECIGRFCFHCMEELLTFKIFKVKIQVLWARWIKKLRNWVLWFWASNIARNLIPSVNNSFLNFCKFWATLSCYLYSKQTQPRDSKASISDVSRRKQWRSWWSNGHVDETEQRLKRAFKKKFRELCGELFGNKIQALVQIGSVKVLEKELVLVLRKSDLLAEKLDDTEDVDFVFYEDKEYEVSTTLELEICLA